MFSKICGYKSYRDKEVWFHLESVMLCFLKVKKKRKKRHREMRLLRIKLEVKMNGQQMPNKISRE